MPRVARAARRRVGAVALEELDVGGDRGQVGAAPGERLSSTRTRWPASHEALREVAADEAGAAGDEDLHGGATVRSTALAPPACSTKCPQSGPVSRILCPASRRATIIPLAPRLPAGSSDLPGGFGRASLERPPIWSCSVWGFPCPPCHQDGGALLPHLFTLATPALSPPEFGGVFSVALSLGSPPLAVNQHTALGVRTFLPGPDDEPRRPSGPLCGQPIA